MKAIGYVRVSTEGQATDGVSMDAQRAKIAAWATVNDAELVDVLEDAGFSGKRADNRDGLQAALDAACREKAVLVVYSLSRLSRSTRDTLAIADRIDKAGADLVSLSEKIDTTTAAGKMVFRMLAVLNEFERDQISERTRFALAYKRSIGEKTGGDVPFGYRLSEDGRTLAPDAGEQEAVRLILSLRDKGLSLRAIAARLNAEGYRTKAGRDWSAVQVTRVLRRAA